MKNSSKKIAILSMLVAISLIMFVIENLLPPLLPIAPYVKIGVSNVLIIYILIVYGEAESIICALAKTLLGSLISGVYALPYNLAGAVLSLIVMIVLYKFVFPKVSIIAISVIGAIVSNIARTLVAVIIMQTKSLFVQLPYVCAFSVVAGIIIGVLVMLLIKFLPEKYTKNF